MMSIFDWMWQKTAQEILDKFYEDHPEIERDDNKALEKDWMAAIKEMHGPGGEFLCCSVGRPEDPVHVTELDSPDSAQDPPDLRDPSRRWSMPPRRGAYRSVRKKWPRGR